MGFGFRRRRGLLGGLLALNLSRHGLGASGGVPGARRGLDGTGRTYARFGIPGTGAFYRARFHHEQARDHAHRHFFAGCMVALVMLWAL